MRVTLYAKLFLLLCCSGGVALVQEEFVELSFDSLYPRNDYFHVERVLKELWSDIDLLLQDPYLYDRFVYDSDYILDQYLALEKSFEKLVNKNDEFSSYLVEDIDYLAQLVEHVARKSELMCSQLEGERSQEVAQAIYEILERCRQHVIVLYEQNKEVIA